MDAIVQAILDWTSKHYAQETAMIASAPVALLVCAGLLAVVAFFILRWQFQHQISTRDGVISIHEERHRLKDEKIAMLANKVGASPDAPLESIAIAANNQIDILQNQIVALKVELEHQRSRHLTPEQRTVLVSRLRQADNFVLQYRVRPDDSEAIQYVTQFVVTLSEIGKSLGAYLPCTTIPLDLRGLVIQVSDKEHISDGAKIFAEALTASGIAYRIDVLPTVHPETLKPRGFALVIGHK
jgi:hypothetical protein